MEFEVVVEDSNMSGLFGQMGLETLTNRLDGL